MYVNKQVVFLYGMPQNHSREVYPGYSPCRNVWKFFTTSGFRTRARDFCKVCTPLAQYPGHGYARWKYPGEGTGTGTTFLYLHTRMNF